MGLDCQFVEAGRPPAVSCYFLLQWSVVGNKEGNPSSTNSSFRRGKNEARSNGLVGALAF